MKCKVRNPSGATLVSLPDAKRYVGYPTGVVRRPLDYRHSHIGIRGYRNCAYGEYGKPALLTAYSARKRTIRRLLQIRH